MTTSCETHGRTFQKQSQMDDDAHNVKGIVRSSALVVGGAEHLLPTVPEIDWSDAIFDVDVLTVFLLTLGKFFVF